MSKKIIFFLFTYFFFSCSHFAFAGLVINEIMYDLKTGADDGREWVEIYNDGDGVVDMSTARFFEADTDHKLKLMQGDAKVGSKSYAVIVSDSVKFKTDWPSFAGTIFDSSFSLSNTGEVLMLKDKDLNIIDQYAYTSGMGGTGDGKSLQKINGVWVGALPTPGTENKITYTPKKPILSKKESAVKETLPLNKVDVKNTENFMQNFEDLILPENVSSPDNSKGYFFIGIFVIFITISSGVVYFIRRNKNKPNPGEDFEILE